MSQRRKPTNETEEETAERLRRMTRILHEAMQPAKAPAPMSKNHSPNFPGNDDPEIAELRERIAKMEVLLQEIADTTLTRDEPEPNA